MRLQAGLAFHLVEGDLLADLKWLVLKHWIDMYRSCIDHDFGWMVHHDLSYFGLISFFFLQAFLTQCRLGPFQSLEPDAGDLILLPSHLEDDPKASTAQWRTELKVIPGITAQLKLKEKIIELRSDKSSPNIMATSTGRSQFPKCKIILWRCIGLHHPPCTVEVERS